MLHEVSHSLLPAHCDRAWHGPEWASLYLRLLKEKGVIKSVAKEKARGIKQFPRKVRFL